MSADRLVPIDRATWETMWNELRDAGKTMPLGGYANHCDRTKKAWRERFGAWRYDNGRYAVHAEEKLERGFPFEFDVTPDDFKYDASCFPLIREELAKVTA